MVGRSDQAAGSLQYFPMRVELNEPRCVRIEAKDVGRYRKHRRARRIVFDQMQRGGQPAIEVGDEHASHHFIQRPGPAVSAGKTIEISPTRTPTPAISMS